MPMRHRVLVCCAAGLCLAALATISPASAQKPVAPKPRSGEGGWVVPRMADGRPDLQGTWENNSATPLERPAAFANKPMLTDAELADMKARAARLFAPDSDAAFGDGFYFALLADRNTAPFGTGSYSANWLPNRLIERRTSLITDPPDGKLPPLTEAAVRATDRRAGRQAALCTRSGRHGRYRSLHFVRRSRSVCRVHERLPHRADTGSRRDRDGENPRHPHHPARRTSAHLSEDPPLHRRLRAAIGKATRSSSRRRISIRTATPWAGCSGSPTRI